MNGKKVLLCVTGGIAAFKAVLLLRLLTRAGADVQVVMTRNATRFVGPTTFEALCNHRVRVDLWESGPERGENHISLAAWANLVAVVPATAHTLARAAHGLADDLLGCILLAAKCPVLVAPAMHEAMYAHPATQANLETLAARGVHIVEPVEGELASGSGKGRLADPEDILEAMAAALTPRDMEGRRIIVTAGPTRELIDPVRFISNHSSGKMGFEVARAAARRGAEVILVSGPTSLPPPPGVKVVAIQTALEMRNELLGRLGETDAVVMAAAVGDYKPMDIAGHKLKKQSEPMTLALERTPDILAELGAWRRKSGEDRPILVGFSMETTDLERFALLKLGRKGCDLIVANDLTEEGAGFGHDTNRVTLVRRDRTLEALPLMSKLEVGHRLLDCVAALLTGGRG